jgi:transposase
VPLIEGLCAGHLPGDKGYDSDEIVGWAERRGMAAVIPPRRNRKVQRGYDRYLYKLRHLVENAFLKLKQWRGVATRYCKRAASFLAFVQIRCLMLWARIS